MTKILIDRSTVEQALEALEYGQHSLKQVSEHEWVSRGELAMQALRAALAEPEQAEPVAWMYRGNDWSINACKAYAKQLRDKTRANTAEHAAEAIEYLIKAVQDYPDTDKVTPLYAAPPKQRAKTEQEQEQAEPVAFVNAVHLQGLQAVQMGAHLQGLPLGLYGYVEIYTEESAGRVPLYAAPPRRKPLTDEQDRALCEAYFNDASDEYFKARPELDFPEMRRIFYAGHRKAWISYEAAHGIGEE